MNILPINIVECYQKIKNQLTLTPILTHHALHNLIQGKVFLKAENLQIGGSFKFRGAFNKISQALALSPDISGFIAGSSGNHAVAVATIARMMGKSALIVMPEDTPMTKITKVKKQKAEIVFYNRYQENREIVVERLAKDSGRHIVPPFNDPDIIVGQGTIIPESFNQLSAMGNTGIQSILRPCGGGGLVSGCAIAASHIFPQSKVYAVEPEHYNDLEKTLETGKQHTNDMQEKTICDSIMTPTVGNVTLPIIQKYNVKAISVSDEDVLKAVHFAAEELNIIVEPGGVVGLAALMRHTNLFFGQHVLVVLSGGNIDPKILMKSFNL